MREFIENEIVSLLSFNQDGHGIDHIRRVVRLSEKFADELGADRELASVIALLHDADDYKLFGTENSEKLPNARRILEKAGADETFIVDVLSEISRIGFGKALKGLRPLTVEGMIVSDADMCDAMGAIGILRTYTYSLNHGQVFFDPASFPRSSFSAEEYVNGAETSGTAHLFEKILKLDRYMLTRPGQKEAAVRRGSVIAFLYEFFREENAQDWFDYLNSYLSDDSLEDLPHKIVGTKEENVAYYERPGCYIVPVQNGKIGLVKNKESYFFIGGGMEKGETRESCLRREVLEETGYGVEIGSCFATAEQFKPDQTDIGYFHPYQYYYTGELTEKLAESIEPDHTLVWFDADEINVPLHLEMQQWALDLLLK